MKTYKVKLVGFDTCEYGSTEKEIEIQAENDSEAEKKAKKWCEENSYMGGYDWFIDRIILGGE